ncbi:MAG TPA: MaoC family dehydratase [Gammaproteobacteria bacterium]|nr:MaoC family dehydratase [Gammaproteobacteria bacterium]
MNSDGPHANVPKPPASSPSADDALLDSELEQTFPASDPLPWTHDVPVHDLYLEDFTVGRRFVTATLEVKASEIKAFAARFDPQLFHLDDDAARSSVFGGLAASGWHTASMTMRLLVTSPMRVPGGLIGLGAEINWPRPTYTGDVLRVESEVIEAKRSRSKPDRGVVTMRHETKNQRDEIVQTAVIKILVPSRG